MDRRLAAILAADVVGFSRLMGADEEGTLSRLKALRTELVQPAIEKGRGRIFKLMGDGLMAEFPSVIGAVQSALDIQEHVDGREPGMPEDGRIRLRIGINVGDVIGEGSDIYGEGVNIAARLEPLADPGGICISDKVHGEVQGKVACVFEDMGEQTLKNIDRPVRAYKVRSASAEGAVSSARPGLNLPGKPSIAVLPFDNMSGDREQEYFADGMVEDIITGLSRIKWLFVIARNSSFTYKGQAVDVKQVGRDLGVRYVLEGSVRRAANRVRITGQLIDAATGAHLWAERFDGDLEDIFELQDQVTQKVVGAIAPMMEHAEIARSTAKPTENLDAYDYFLRGMAAFHQYSKPGNAQAAAHFSKARELDPGYAAAYGMGARCYAQRRGFGWIEDPEGEREEARELARIAADVGRGDAVALAAAGFGLMMVGEIEDGDAYLDRALALDPNMAWAWHTSGMSKTLMGSPELTVERASHAMRLSPQDPQLFAMQAMVAAGHYFAGRIDEAYRWGEAALRERPNFLFAAGITAASAAEGGRMPEAERAMARFREIDPSWRVSNLHEWFALRRPEDAERWARALRKAGLPD